jgi:ABC-type polysaccharide/polyol phosphate export permease
MAVTIAAIGIVFGTIFGTPLQIFLPYLASGLITWGLISGILNEGNKAFIDSEGMIKQLPLPKMVFVVRVVWRNLIVSAHNIVIFPVATWLVGGETGWSLLLWPAGVFTAVLCLSGLALIFAVIAARYRDLPQIVSAVLTVGFYLTPVIWIKGSLGNNDLVLAIVNANPFYHILSVVRLPLIGQFPSVENWIWVICSAVLFWTFGHLLFKRYEKRIAYWV